MIYAIKIGCHPEEIVSQWDYKVSCVEIIAQKSPAKGGTNDLSVKLLFSALSFSKLHQWLSPVFRQRACR
jgi:hypothetical protein